MFTLLIQVLFQNISYKHKTNRYKFLLSLNRCNQHESDTMNIDSINISSKATQPDRRVPSQ